MMDQTHAPELQSWVSSANEPGCDFPIQNLPLGVFQPAWEHPRIGVAIGDSILDVSSWLPGSSLNEYCALPRSRRVELRREWSRLLQAGSAPMPLFQQSSCEMLLPVQAGDYTDFYASIHHATNVGSMFRPDNPLLPNYKHIPIAYHGRSSTLVVSGKPIHRPQGQLGEGKFGASRELDYEVELGIVVGPGNERGTPVTIDQAAEHIAGVCLLNDWSARDIQRWEYQPLGPFLAKNFATSLSPWLVTAEALEPFRCAAPSHDVPVLPYLQEKVLGAIDLQVECWLQTRAMNSPIQLSKGHYKDMYWTMAQMLTHHTVNGCQMRPGDVMGSGTISGPEKSNRGCLLELTWKGTDPIVLPTGEKRTFLEAGDTITLKAYAEREGARRIGLGECRGSITA